MDVAAAHLQLGAALEVQGIAVHALRHVLAAERTAATAREEFAALLDSVEQAVSEQQQSGSSTGGQEIESG